MRDDGEPVTARRRSIRLFVRSYKNRAGNARISNQRRSPVGNGASDTKAVKAPTGCGLRVAGSGPVVARIVFVGTATKDEFTPFLRVNPLGHISRHVKNPLGVWPA